MKNTPETLAKRNALREHWRNTIDPASFPHEILRMCKMCGEEKLCRWMSSFTQTGKPEYRARCKECQNSYERTWSSNNRAKRTSQALDRKSLNKQRYIKYLGGSCADCGYSKCEKALTFHHRDPSEKSFEISKKMDYAWLDVKDELDKCDLLCFNCHMERHCVLDHSARTVAGHPRNVGCAHLN